MEKALNNQHSATIDEVLEAINVFADKTEGQFSEIKGQLNKMDGRIGGLESRVGGLESRIGKIEGQIGQIIEKMTTLVTKDYLDEKLTDLRGDLVVMMRKADIKLESLIGVLKEKAVLSVNDVKRIYSLESFVQ